MNCYAYKKCENFRDNDPCERCANYKPSKPKLPKVTMKEVGLRFWESTNEN